MHLFSRLAILILVIFIACTPSKKSTSSAEKGDKYVEVDQLINYINRFPKLMVRGNEVYNTSASTIRGSTSPLFVVEGVQIGRRFSAVLRMLDQNKKVSVEFIPMSRATIQYGEKGNNGVVIIKYQQQG